MQSDGCGAELALTIVVDSIHRCLNIVDSGNLSFRNNGKGGGSARVSEILGLNGALDGCSLSNYGVES